MSKRYQLRFMNDSPAFILDTESGERLSLETVCELLNIESEEMDERKQAAIQDAREFVKRNVPEANETTHHTLTEEDWEA